MARGWESKSVEEQQSQSQAQPPEPAGPQLTEEQRRRNRELESLRLARARITQQLAAATDERYKRQLQAALQDLDRRLSGRA
jgi:hypothetical protein